MRCSSRSPRSSASASFISPCRWSFSWSPRWPWPGTGRAARHRRRKRYTVDDGIRTLIKVATVFASLSLVSVGGGNTVLPEIHRAAVHDEQWMSDQQFADIYAISEAAPGPSSMISSLVGYKAGGLLGALVAMAAILGPSSLLMYVACLTWERFRTAKWRIAFEKGLAPVSLGLLF